jgi:hypothetical protein
MTSGSNFAGDYIEGSNYCVTGGGVVICATACVRKGDMTTNISKYFNLSTGRMIVVSVTLWPSYFRGMFLA